MGNPRDVELNIIGHDRTGAATRSAGNNIDQLKRKTGDLDKSTKKSTQSIADSFSGIASGIRGGGTFAVLAAIRTALMALPAAGSLSAGGIVLALGGGLAALGLMFAAKNKAIRDEFKKTFDGIGKTLQQISKPFEPVLMHLAKLIRDTFAVFTPQLRASFEKMAPAVDRMFSAMAVAIQNMAPAIGPVTDAFIALLDALGPELPGIATSLSNAIIAIANSIKANPQTFATLIKFLSNLVVWTLKAIAVLSSMANWFQQHSNFAKVAIAGSIGPLTAALAAQILVVKKVAPAIGSMAAAAVSKLSAFASGAQSRLSAAANATGTAVGRIRSYLGSIRDRAFRVIAHIPDISGAINRIKGLLNSLFDKVISVKVNIPNIAGKIGGILGQIGRLPGFDNGTSNWAGFDSSANIGRSSGPTVSVAAPLVNNVVNLDVDSLLRAFKVVVRQEIKAAQFSTSTGRR